MLTPIEQVRLNVQDNNPGFYMLSDDEIQFLLDESKGNVGRASIRAAQIILFKLAQQGDETVDIFSLRGSKAAEAYRQALLLYITNPSLNPLMQDMNIYTGGISKSDIAANNANLDNNIIISPNQDRPPVNEFPGTWRFVI